MLRRGVLYLNGLTNGAYCDATSTTRHVSLVLDIQFRVIIVRREEIGLTGVRTRAFSRRAGAPEPPGLFVGGIINSNNYAQLLQVQMILCER